MSQERRLQSMSLLQVPLRMTAMIDTLLDYSKIGGAQKSEVNLNEIQHVIHDLANQIQQANAQVTCKELPTIQGYELSWDSFFKTLSIMRLSILIPRCHPS